MPFMASIVNLQKDAGGFSVLQAHQSLKPRSQKKDYMHSTGLNMDIPTQNFGCFSYQPIQEKNWCKFFHFHWGLLCNSLFFFRLHQENPYPTCKGVSCF